MIAESSDKEFNILVENEVIEIIKPETIKHNLLNEARFY